MPLTEEMDETLVNRSPEQEPRDTARRTLALRIAQRNRLRAERLARLRTRSGADGTESAAELLPEEDAASGLPEVARRVLQPDVAPARSPVADTAPTSPVPVSAAADPDDDAGDALEEFLRALSGSAAAAPREDPAPEPAAVLQFQRPGPDEREDVSGGFIEPLAAPVCDLDRLRGAGPGLIWALQRAGIACLADLAPLEPGELSARLGPLGRLVPATAWIGIARGTVATAS